MKIKDSEKISFYSHASGIIGALAGTIVLVLMTKESPPLLATTLIYGLSCIFLFSASTLYHYNKKSENENTIWRKLDHLAIFLMIAGTYTPMCWMFLTGTMRTAIIVTQWSLVLMGLFFKLFFINAPRFLNTAVYLAMGWIVLIPLKQLLSVFPVNVILYTVLGALAYTAGGIIYAIKKPDIKPGVFGFHEIFHVFILAGSFFHFLMVYSSVAYKM